MQSNPQIIRDLLSPDDIHELKSGLTKWTSAAAHAPTERQRFSFARYSIFDEPTRAALQSSGVADMPPSLNLARQATQRCRQVVRVGGAVLTVCPSDFNPEGKWTPLGIEGFEKVAAVHVALSPYR